MKKILLTISILLIGILGFSQNKIMVEAPNIVGLNERFTVTFMVEGSGSLSNFNWEAGSNFDLLWGPQTSTSKSYSIINGKATSSSSYSYSYMLRANKLGKFQLPVATAKMNGQIWKSDPISIEVLKTSSTSTNSTSNNASSSDYIDEDDDNSQSVTKSELFLKMFVDKRNVVVGEPLRATIKLYQNANIAGFEDAKFPTFTGFWSQETFTPNNIQFTRENYNNRIYNVATIRGYMLIPQQVGKLRIDPANLVCLVNIRDSHRRATSIFDDMFDDGYTTVKRRLSTEPIIVNVNPLPSNAPASFGGGVGTFSISAHISNSSLKMHDAASVIVTISGKGNVSLLEAPKINFPPDFEAYDVKTNDNTDKNSGGTQGSKTFEYPFIPRAKGSFDIPPIEYTYYDVNLRKYVTLSTKPIHINVAKSDDKNSSGVMVQPVISRNGVENIGQDIRYINVENKELVTHKYFVAQVFYYILIIVFIILAIIIFLVIRKLEFMRADIVGSRNRAATRMARKRLKLAFDYLNKGENAHFYEELHKGLIGFISDKLNMRVEDLNRDNIGNRLIDKGVSKELVDRFLSLIDACEFARYSPNSGSVGMNLDFDEAVNVISSIDSVMKGKKSNKATILSSVIVLMLLPSFLMNAAPVDSLWVSGIRAYKSGHWNDAVISWQKIDSTGIKSARLYYNIGNAYYKESEYGKAILNWERALKIDPSYRDAGYNLALAQNNIQDKIDPVPEFLFKSVAKKICYLMSSNTWAILSLMSFVLLLAFIILFVRSNDKIYKKLGFYLGVVMLVFTITFWGFARWQYQRSVNDDSAIITSPVVSVKSSPTNDSAKNLFVLHEGTKIRILDRVGNWYNISLADGRQGWLLATDMEVI